MPPVQDLQDKDDHLSHEKRQIYREELPDIGMLSESGLQGDQEGVGLVGTPYSNELRSYSTGQHGDYS